MMRPIVTAGSCGGAPGVAPSPSAPDDPRQPGVRLRSGPVAVDGDDVAVDPVDRPIAGERLAQLRLRDPARAVSPGGVLVEAEQVEHATRLGDPGEAFGVHRP